MTIAIWTLFGLWAVGIIIIGWAACRAGALADQELERMYHDDKEGPKC